MANEIHETFPHDYEDGYHFTGNWRSITFWGLYRNTLGFPYQWDKCAKRKKIVSEFIVGMQRGKKIEKKCWYGCTLIYKFSEN